MQKRNVFVLIFLWVSLGCSGKDLALKIRYERIQGLEENNRVLFDGNPIGEVTRIHYTQNGDYIVDLKIRNNFANAATEHSRFYIVRDPHEANKKAVEILQIQKGGKPLADGSHVDGAVGSSLFFEEMVKELERGFDNLKTQIEQFLADFASLPESEQVRELEKELKELAQEMQRAGKETRNRIQKEILPLIKEQLEQLKNRLKKFGREQDVKPLENQLDELIKT